PAGANKAAAGALGTAIGKNQTGRGGSTNPAATTTAVARQGGTGTTALVTHKNSPQAQVKNVQPKTGSPKTGPARATAVAKHAPQGQGKSAPSTFIAPKKTAAPALAGAAKQGPAGHAAAKTTAGAGHATAKATVAPKNAAPLAAKTTAGAGHATAKA